MNPHDSTAATIHFDRNRQSRGDWDGFAQHRTHVTALIQAVGRRRDVVAASDRHELVILGIGNGNDIDLESVVGRYDSTTLVDLDDEAVTHCRSRLPIEVTEKINLVTPIDLTGMLEQMPMHGAEPMPWNETDWDRWLALARDPQPVGVPLGDVVISTCLLSQMLDSVVGWLPPSHPRLAEAMLAVRDGHLRLLTRLTRTGGTSVLITDFVSSDTLPALGDVAAERMPMMIQQAVESRNFFTGLHPGVLVQRLSFPTTDRAAATAVHGPWRWKLGPRTFAVAAISTEMK